MVNYHYHGQNKLITRWLPSMIKAGEIVCDEVYLNSSYNFKQWYDPFENKNWGKTIVRLDAITLTKVKVKSINDVALPIRSSNNLRGGSIRFGYVSIFDGAHDEILETIFKKITKSR